MSFPSMNFPWMSFPSKRHRSMRTENYRPRNPPSSSHSAIQPLAIDALSGPLVPSDLEKPGSPYIMQKWGLTTGLNDTAGNPAISALVAPLRPEALRPRLPAGLPIR
jgi:hypothetical protein